MAKYTFTLTAAQDAAIKTRLGDFEAYIQAIIDNALEDHAKWRLANLANSAGSLTLVMRHKLMDKAEKTIKATLSAEEV